MGSVVNFIVFVFAIAFFLLLIKQYILGQTMAKNLDLYDVSIYRKYNSPRFYIIGPKEYRLILNYILNGKYKSDNLNKICLSSIEKYHKLLLLSLSIYLVVFIVMVVLIESGII